MKARGIPSVVIFLLAIGVLSACVPTAEPGCTIGDLVQPIPSGPIDDFITNDLQAPIQWSYPAGYECQPDGFRLEIAEDQNFHTVVTTGETAAFVTTWTPSTPYQALSEFWWRVAGGVEDAGTLELGPWSEPQRFFTGPVCDPAHQTSPDLIWPSDGEVIDTILPLLEWSYPGPGCTPEGYRIDLSTEPAFADTSLSGGTGNPRTKWFPGDDSVDCTVYYWRVAPIVGITLGPASSTFSFQTNVSGACIMTSSISGMVWHDMCGLPELGPYPPYPPPGCADVGGGMWGGNATIDPGEPGLEGVVIHLGAGACPSTGLATATTDANGNYSFGGLGAGTYCVSVDSLADGNDLDLIPGGWSYPTTGSSLTSHEVTIAMPGETAQANFGWDFQFLPAYAGGLISGLVWHDLCAVPDGPLPEVPPEGCVAAGGGGSEANGIYEAGEPGIEGVVVNLGAGSCPSTGLWTTTTAADGTYYVEGLVDGTYCVSVDALGDGNDAVLIPGGWTYPVSGVNPATHEVVVTAPNEQADINFGWDYQFLPAPLSSKAVQSKLNSNCRSGPSLRYPILWIMLKGKEAFAEGRNEAGTWLYIRRMNGEFCWIAEERVIREFDIQELAIQEALPPPPAASISGWAYSDFNGSGTRDKGDGSIHGAQLTLKSGACPGGSTLGMEETDSDGRYSFTNLGPGTYCIVTNPLQQSLTPTSQSVTVAAGEDKDNVNFRR